MGIFGKAPLDADFEHALHRADAVTGNRKMISKSQDIIRNELTPGEELRMVAAEDYTGTRTVVVTNQRLLVFRNRFGSGVSKSLEYQCSADELDSVTLQQTNTESYDLVIEGVNFIARIKVREYLKGKALVRAAEALKAG